MSAFWSQYGHILNSEMSSMQRIKACWRWQTSWITAVLFQVLRLAAGVERKGFCPLIWAMALCAGHRRHKRQAKSKTCKCDQRRWVCWVCSQVLFSAPLKNRVLINLLDLTSHCFVPYAEWRITNCMELHRIASNFIALISLEFLGSVDEVAMLDWSAMVWALRSSSRPESEQTFGKF